jgi:hypothetical protein
MANTAIGHRVPRNSIAKLFQPDILSQDGLSSDTNMVKHNYSQACTPLGLEIPNP